MFLVRTVVHSAKLVPDSNAPPWYVPDTSMDTGWQGTAIFPHSKVVPVSVSDGTVSEKRGKRIPFGEAPTKFRQICCQRSASVFERLPVDHRKKMMCGPLLLMWKRVPQIARHTYLAY
jgi:hypothetical protein